MKLSSILSSSDLQFGLTGGAIGAAIGHIYETDPKICGLFLAATALGERVLNNVVVEKQWDEKGVTSLGKFVQLTTPLLFYKFTKIFSKSSKAQGWNFCLPGTIVGFILTSKINNLLWSSISHLRTTSKNSQFTVKNFLKTLPPLLLGLMTFYLNKKTDPLRILSLIFFSTRLLISMLMNEEQDKKGHWQLIHLSQMVMMTGVIGIDYRDRDGLKYQQLPSLLPQMVLMEAIYDSSLFCLKKVAAYFS